MLYLSKVLTALVSPLGVGLLVAIVAFGLLWCSRRWAGLLLAAAIAWLWTWSMPAFSDWMRGTLESRHPPRPIESLPRVDAIVVLGGAAWPGEPPYDHNLNSAADRIWHAARLYRAGRAKVIVASGGRLPWVADGASEASVMRSLLADLGVPADAVILEEDSATTWDNATGTRRVLRAKKLSRVLLVTSALHMPRALETFRAAGIDATPAPTDFEVSGATEAMLLAFLPSTDALDGGSRAFKEYLGAWVYRVRRWVDAPT